jgi:hypothetical protein
MERKVLDKNSSIMKFLMWPRPAYDACRSHYPKDSCQLVRMMIWKVLKTILVIGILSFLAFCLVASPIVFFFSAVLKAYPFLKGFAVIGGVLWVSIGFLGLILGIIWIVVEAEMKLDNYDFPRWEKSKDTVKFMYRSWKDKVCTKLDFQ